MRKFRSIGIAALAVAAICAPARADMWSGPLGTSPVVAGNWFIGTGVVGGIYSRPDWRAPFARFPDDAPNVQNSFNQNFSVVGPGATLGYVFPDGAMPAWMGKRVRVTFSFLWWTGDRSDNTTAGVFDDPNAVIVAQNGLVGLSAAVGGGDTTIDERLRSSVNAYEFQLRLAGDRHLAPSLYWTPSIGAFGGIGLTRHTYTAVIRDDGALDAFFQLGQRIRSYTAGGDIGAALTWMVFGDSLRLIVAGRGGVYWTRASMQGNDCFINAGLPSCPVAPGTFVPNGFFNTSTSASDSQIGFRGTVTGGMAVTWGRFTFTAGGFFTWYSAVPSINNPSINLANQPAANTTVGRPRISFDSGYTAGGMFVVTLALN